MEEALTSREHRVLRSVIGQYVRSAHPVSSGAIARSREVRVSPATVRNVMRILEERGLIRQPHTSAGRVPTDEGYRYFVDHLMKPARLTRRQEEQLTAIAGTLLKRDRGALATTLSSTASALLRELAVALVPAAGAPRIERVHYDGAKYFFRHEELAGDLDFLGELFDSDRVLADLVRGRGAPGGVTVTIGAENDRPGMRRVSLVVGSYRVGDGIGHVGVIGSTRMHYAKVVGLVSRLTATIDDVFGRA